MTAMEEKIKELEERIKQLEAFVDHYCGHYEEEE